jgi:hypothetical protein
VIGYECQDGQASRLIAAAVGGAPPRAGIERARCSLAWSVTAGGGLGLPAQSRGAPAKSALWPHSAEAGPPTLAVTSDLDILKDS